MPRRGEITVTVQDDGRVELHRNRVPLLPGPTDEDHAREVIRRTRTPGERVTKVELDGYRVDLTRDYERDARRELARTKR